MYKSPILTLVRLRCTLIYNIITKRVHEDHLLVIILIKGPYFCVTNAPLIDIYYKGAFTLYLL